MPKRKPEAEPPVAAPEAAEEEEEEAHEEIEAGSSGSPGSSGDGSGSSDGSSPEVSDEEDSEDDADGEAFEEIQVDFQFFDPAERDFHGLRALLHNFLDGEAYDTSGLVDTIIKQSTVGTVVKAGDDEDPVAVMTALNTQRYSQLEGMQQIRSFIERRCPEKKSKEQLLKAWDSPGTALLLNERIINTPPQLAPPLVQALFDEVQWATEDEPTQELRDSFRLQRYVLLTRVYSDPEAEAAAGPSSSAAAAAAAGGRRGKGEGAGRQPVLVFVRPEDEYFSAQASVCATFPVEGRSVGKGELVPLRMLMLLPASKVPAARKVLDEVVGNPAAG